jgi:hypothetical protein
MPGSGRSRSPGPAANGSGALWYRLRLTVAEMNYATRRTVELQAPWISDNHLSRRRGMSVIHLVGG